MAFIYSTIDKDILYWLKQASLQGDAESQTLLGLKYEMGKGVKKDKQKAIELYTSAAQKGSKRASERLDELLSATEK